MNPIDAVGESLDLHTPDFSTAGFYSVDPAIRGVADFNPGWRFHLGDAEDAHMPGFDDSAWDLVNLPHGLEILPLEASGSLNYQGPAWYRKHFETPDDVAPGRRVFLHFEAIMGHSQVWLNGQPLTQHFGGYLPIHLDVTDALSTEESNVLAVRADNSNDPSYPPGKPQSALDFTYFGGIYRDVWMITASPIHISHANHVDEVAGGGVFFHTRSLSSDRATARVKTHTVNHSDADTDIRVSAILSDAGGKTVAESSGAASLPAGGGRHIEFDLDVTSPMPWHPDAPHLYDLFVKIHDAKQNLLDILRLRVGLRTVELRGKEGLFLNGQPFEGPLVGANRHQDFAYLGNAIPNTTHWRDAKKLRDAGMRIIRGAHYPMDPAFMDACDELGLFVIVATPGWQFFQEDDGFPGRVVVDIRQMVRRDRNYASLFAWEPILNETPYPEDFALRCAGTVKEEYPVPGCYLGCDSYADAAPEFELMYGTTRDTDHRIQAQRWWRPLTDEERQDFLAHYEDAGFFIREFGDGNFVDDWNAQDSPSRVNKAWGEAPQLVQARHYAMTLRGIYHNFERTPQDIGGCIWHPFDHQRGYHPDAFWGGMLDATRQPKYSYYVFMAQRDPDLRIPHVASGPFVRILNEAAAASDPTVTVVSNCDEIRLLFNGEEIGVQPTSTQSSHGMREPVVFEDAYMFSEVKQLIRAGRQDEVSLVAEGLIDGQVVATHPVVNAGRRTQLQLEADFSGAAFTADGSDILPVVASVTDKHGRVKRLAQKHVCFTVTGAGQLVGDNESAALAINPQPVRWGEAVALVRADYEPGPITIRVEDVHDGIYTLEPAELTVHTNPARFLQVYTEKTTEQVAAKRTADRTAIPGEVELREQLMQTQRELNELRLREVERTQEERATNQ